MCKNMGLNEGVLGRVDLEGPPSFLLGEEEYHILPPKFKRFGLCVLKYVVCGVKGLAFVITYLNVGLNCLAFVV